MSSVFKARIVGLGNYLPKRILTNQDLEKMVDTTDEWIASRTGIQERRIGAPDEFPSDMGYYAAEQALKAAQVSPKDIDLILLATITSDYLCPSTAALVQSKLKATRAAALDIQAACTGFLYALSIAKAYIEAGIYRRVLVIASEKLSSITDYQDRNTCVLFGDGASAAVVSNEGEGWSIDAINLGADGDQGGLLVVEGGGSRLPATEESIAARKHFLKMEGKEVFKHAIRRMTAAAKKCLGDAGLTEKQILWIIPHQANIRILEALSRSLNVPMEKVFITLQKYGNTSASSIAIALTELTQKESFSEGDAFLLVAFGGGLTWGAAILTKIGAAS